MQEKLVQAREKTPWFEEHFKLNRQRQFGKSSKKEDGKLHVGLICGGPSLERGISLNSARSVLDHLSCDAISIYPLYVDHEKRFYQISTAQLYSNTPSDFDFKLACQAKQLTTSELVRELKKLSLVFPVIHGAFGEDGELQSFLEQYDIPFVGSASYACKRMFHKYKAAAILQQHGYETIPSVLLRKGDTSNITKINNFFEQYKLLRAVVKPVAGGSSIGVFSVTTKAEAIQKCAELFVRGLDSEAIVEPFFEGCEFTVIVLQNAVGDPVALVPSEIQISYKQGQFFDYRRKYLPTANTRWPCPPTFSDDLVARIRAQAEAIFKIFGMRDFARLDGWVLNNKQILFTDLNPISGMEQNSFLFQQASRVGMSHQDVFLWIISRVCERENIKFSLSNEPQQDTSNTKRKLVKVLFGGNTAERQVSLMSGTNVWLKLRRSKQYKAEPYFLDMIGDVWHLPYTFALNHTVEEIYTNCLAASHIAARLDKVAKEIRNKLGLKVYGYDVCANVPQKYSLVDFLRQSSRENAFVFLALHGGYGENGGIQRKLKEYSVTYNGSNAAVSELCMDKYLTGEVVTGLRDAAIVTAKRVQIQISQFTEFSSDDYQDFWQTLVQKLQADTLIIKPKCDGCSAGIVHLCNARDLAKYIDLIKNKATYIAPNTFANQDIIIEMAQDLNAAYIIEAFITTDVIKINKNELIYQQHGGWVELTIGVLESRGKYHVMSPSITVAAGEVLSLEEKFQGGTGVNITPPPGLIMPQAAVNKLQDKIAKVANAIKLKNYARIDVFFNVKTQVTMIIEINTLPALTPSTVIYHQALAESQPIYPLAFLERLIASV